jgi:release factor glutamine methyltransferase
MDTDVSGLVARLRAAGCVFAEDEAALLAAAASGPALDGLVDRRVAGEPLEQVLGWAEFCGLRFVVEPGVFVPRQRSRLLVREAVRRAAPGSVVLDLCCGTGAVGAAVAAAVPGIEVHAADVDPAATACARENLGALGSVHTGDLFSALPPSLRGRIDVVAANAPYVPTDAIALMPPEAREHEARIALDGGEDGLDLHRRIAADAPGWLAPGGRLLIETSARQAPATAQLMAAAGLRPRTVRSEDLDGTVVVGRLERGAGAPRRPQGGVEERPGQAV